MSASNPFAEFRRKTLQKKGIVETEWIIDGYFKYMTAFGWMPYEQYLNENAEIVVEIMERIDKQNDEMKASLSKGRKK